MKRFCMALLAVLAVAALHASTSEAGSRYIGVTGTASGAGSTQITIESFEPNGEPRIGTMAVVTVPIPNGSTAANSASLIRSGLAAGLGPDYEATLPSGLPGTVKINYKPGGITMTVIENVPVPGQTIQEVSINLPATGPAVAVGLGLLLAAMGGLVLFRRRSAVRADSVSA